MNEETVNDDEDYVPPVKEHSLKNYVKQYSDKRAGGNAIDSLISDLEELARLMWLYAEGEADKDGRKTIKERDIQKAFDELLKPHEELVSAAREMRSTADDLDQYAEEAPIYGGIEK